jgi:uncharacterized surface protein with fasciclin (FAS1) repeats
MNRKRVIPLLMLLFVVGVMGAAAQERQPSQALVRVAQLAIDIEAIDVIVDREVRLTNVAFFSISDHLTLEPGKHTIALVAAGGDMANTLGEPVIVDLVDGYSYILNLIGQRGDNSLLVRVIDETTTFKNANLDATGEQTIILNGVSDSPALDFYLGEERVIKGLVFGDFAAVNFPLRELDARFVGDGQPIYEVTATYGLSNNTSMLALVGDFPDRYGVFVTNYSPLNALDYLNGFSDHNEVHFNIIAEAFETAGLAGSLNFEGPFTLFVPSDEALSALPSRGLDDLLNNPVLLKTTLRAHIVPERLTVEDLIAQADERGTVRLTSLGGSELSLVIDQTITINNQVEVTSYDWLMGNGVVHIVDGLLDVSEELNNVI